MKDERLETLVIDAKDLKLYMYTRTILSIIEVNKSKLVILVTNEPNYKAMSELGISINTSNPPRNIFGTRPNVAIASAVTAYARVMMMEIKAQLGDSLFYSDTDSVITNKKLPDTLISKELGM
jgi:hypothetical protein